MNAIDDISRRRNRQQFAARPFELDCDTGDCVARAVFDSKRQMLDAGWLVTFSNAPDGYANVNVHCPTCVQRKREPVEPQQAPSFFRRSRE